MDAVDIVTGHDILGHLTNIITVLSYTRVQYKQLVVGETVHGLAHTDMIGCQHLRALGLSAIGIDPSVQLHPTFMTLVDHPLQGIPIRTGGFTLLTRQESTPGFELALIEGVTLRTHLEDDHVHTVLLQLVKLIGQRLLHLLCSHTLELSVNTLDPRTAHLPLLGTCCHRKQQRHR